jgi:hypothetical protein
MTKQEFTHIYGKSVYATRLDIASDIYRNSSYDGKKSLEFADRFITVMLSEDKNTVENMFE